jgi:hypothetical protein
MEATLPVGTTHWTFTSESVVLYGFSPGNTRPKSLLDTGELVGSSFGVWLGFFAFALLVPYTVTTHRSRSVFCPSYAL